MQELYSLIEKLTSPAGVSGFENMAFDGVVETITNLEIFDEINCLPVGSIYGIMRCGKTNAPLVLLDAHLDTVGFVVTEICSGGFLRVAPIGGIAPKILSSSVVKIYGKQTIKGIFSSTPPHLQGPNDSTKKQEVTEMFIDTGLSVEALKANVRVGTPVGFVCELQRLLNDNLLGASFDDRLCGAIILRALKNINKHDLNIDIAFQFSGNEETGYKGAMTTAYKLQPDKAIVVDVTHAFVPGAPDVRKGIRAGDGVDICFSPQTNRSFTKHAVKIAEENNIPFQISAAPVRTGTNSNAVQTTGNGIPTLLLSVPLKNMHTMSEIVNLKDAIAVFRTHYRYIKTL